MADIQSSQVGHWLDRDDPDGRRIERPDVGRGQVAGEHALCAEGASDRRIQRPPDAGNDVPGLEGAAVVEGHALSQREACQVRASSATTHRSASDGR